jgi:hypothetical protein
MAFFTFFAACPSVGQLKRRNKWCYLQVTMKRMMLHLLH